MPAPTAANETNHNETMTVGELRHKLREYDDDTRVVVHGYEGGYCDVFDVSQVDIILDVHEAHYYGPHEKVGRTSSEEKDETAVLL